MVRFSKESIQRNAVRVYGRFMKLRGEPHAIAMGLALGFFVGMSPLMGLHSVIAVALAAVFKWSKIAALIGVFVTNPLTAPVIYPVSYAFGAAVLGNPVSLGAGGLNLGDILSSSPQVLANLFVGGGILGLAGGAGSYIVAIRAVRQYRLRRWQRAHGEAPFAAVRRRLMRVARRQRGRSKNRQPKKAYQRESRRTHQRRRGALPVDIHPFGPYHPCMRSIGAALPRTMSLGPYQYSGRVP